MSFKDDKAGGREGGREGGEELTLLKEDAEALNGDGLHVVRSVVELLEDGLADAAFLGRRWGERGREGGREGGRGGQVGGCR